MDNAKSQIKFNNDNENKIHKEEAIKVGKIYVKESPQGYSPGQYYFVSWKNHPEAKNNEKSVLTI